MEKLRHLHIVPHRESVGSNAFNIEYLKNSFNQELKDDIVSYMGEYRFQLQKYDYELIYSKGEDGSLGLRDTNRKELMRIKGQRAIEAKSNRGEPTHREEAEDKGFALLDKVLANAQTGDTLLWGSPPGPKEEGYGEYGFIYAGEVIELSDTEKRIKMTAIRVEQPDIAQYNQAFSLLTGKTYANTSADQYLAEPALIEGGVDKRFVDQALGTIFHRVEDNNQQAVFANVMRKLTPSIEEFIAFTSYASREEKLQAFYALENYALELKNRYETTDKEEKVVFVNDFRHIPLFELQRLYGYEPTVVAGSCGSTASLKSNDISNQFSALKKALFGDNEEWFNCPKCSYKADGPIGNTCPGCGLTKEIYAEEGGEVC